MGTNTFLKIVDFFKGIWAYVLSAYAFVETNYVYYMDKFFKVSKPIDLSYLLIFLLGLIVIIIIVSAIVNKTKKKKITFYVDGKKYLDSKCKYRSEIIFPGEIRKEGKKFECWCTDKNLTKEFLQTKLNKNKNVKLYAKFVDEEKIEEKVEEVVEQVTETAEVVEVETDAEKVFDIGELYDSIRYEMLTYERATPFKQLGISRKQIIAEMFEKNGKIYLYFAIDPNLMREKGYNVMDYQEPEFKIVPCKKVVESFKDYDEVVNIIKETMLLNNFVKSDVVLATKVKSDENVRKSGFAFYVKNDIIATSASQYYILLRSIVLSYKMSAIKKNSEIDDKNMILKIFKKGEKVSLYLALNAEIEGLEFVGYDKNFMDTPAKFEINTADDCVKAQVLIDKLMYRYGMEKHPSETEIDLEENLESSCGFGYKIRR